jgi:glyoxylase-like metal-dependent hydrolase (beta-lactamase superfamily II)
MRVNRIRPDIAVLADQLDVPGIGHLAVNAFVLHAAEPVVIDTGLSLPDRGFLDALAAQVDPADVEWIWLTHPDPDHTGGLFELLAAAPRARIITTFAGMGILSARQPLPIERVYLLNPGQSLDVGDRTLTAFRPPLFDSPATVGCYDDRSGACFTSDCFGAPLPTADLATADEVVDVAAAALCEAQLLWATVDSPWVHQVDPAKFTASTDPLRRADPALMLSTHLPPITGRNHELFAMLNAAPAAPAFVGPDQQALEQLLAGPLMTSR